LSVDLRVEERVALVTIDRPEALNALSTPVLHALRDVLGRLDSDPDVGVVVLTGAGERAFIAGADISELRTMTPVEARGYAELGQACAHALESLRRPTIAAVNGFALGGGCEMALACDLRLASANARFGQPEINLGLIPGWGGTQRLARATGIGFAKELVLSGRLVGADEALARGLVNAVHPPDELLPRTLELAGEIARKSPLALAHAKDAINRALQGDLGGNLAHEADLFALLLSTEDAREGLAAFAEKREPRFAGR
jgi:enoyl-CoA hydratase